MKARCLAAIGALVLGSACGSQNEPAPSSTVPITVQMTVVGEQTIPESFEAGGTIRARQRAAIASRIVAPIVDITVAPGDRVRAGQPLIRLDDRELDARARQAAASLEAAKQAVERAAAERAAAEAGVSLAEATYRRIDQLAARQSATPQELDEARSARDEAQARLTAATAAASETAATLTAAAAATRATRVTASYAVLSAPFDGRVAETLADPGTMAAPGVPLLILEDTRRFRLEVRLDASRAAAIAPGQAVDVLLDRPAEDVLKGEVAEIAQAIDPTAHAFTIKIDLPTNARVRSGMFGRARFSGPDRRVLALPLTSIIRRGQLTQTFVVGHDDTARVRLVRLGSETDGRVEILAGLEPGERVVASPPRTLRDRAPVSMRHAGGGPARPGEGARP